MSLFRWLFPLPELCPEDPAVFDPEWTLGQIHPVKVLTVIFQRLICLLFQEGTFICCQNINLIKCIFFLQMLSQFGPPDGGDFKIRGYVVCHYQQFHFSLIPLQIVCTMAYCLILPG